MAEKTLVYEVVIKNGHGKNTSHYVGQTKKHISKALKSEHVKIESIKSLGQKKVSVRPDAEQDDYAAFNIPISETQTLEITPSELGYKFLRDKFQTQVDELEEDIEKFKNDPYS